MGCPVLTYAGDEASFEKFIPKLQHAVTEDAVYTFRRKAGEFSNIRLTKLKFVKFRSNKSSQNTSKSNKSPVSMDGLFTPPLIPPLVSFFVVSVHDDITFLPKQSVFSEWVSYLSDMEATSAAIIILPADKVKLTKLGEKVRQYYGCKNKSIETKTLVLLENKKSSFDECLYNINIYISEAVSKTLKEYELKLGELSENCQSKHWDIRKFLASTEYLVGVYEAISVNEAMNEVYKTVDASLDEMSKQYFNGDSIGWLSSLDVVESWHGVCIQEIFDGKTLHQIVVKKKSLSYLDLRNIIFCRRFLIMMKLSPSLNHVLSVSTEFVFKISTDISSSYDYLKLTKEHRDCWLFVTALDILLYLKDKCAVNLYDFPGESALLWNLARSALERLGKFVGLYSSKPQTSDQLTSGLQLMSGVNQSDNAEASVHLRKALSSKSNFDDMLVYLFEMTISTYKHKKWQRFAKTVAINLADFHVANNNNNLAEKYYSEAADSFLHHGFVNCERHLRQAVFRCNNNPVDADVSSLLSAAISTDLSESVRETVLSEIYRKDLCTSRSSMALTVTSANYIHSAIKNDIQTITEFELSVHSKFLSPLTDVRIRCKFSSNHRSYLNSYIKGHQSLMFSRSRPLFVDGSTADSNQTNSLASDREKAGEKDIIEAFSREFTTTIKPGVNCIKLSILFPVDGFYILKWVDFSVGNVTISPRIIDATLEYQVKNLAPRVVLKNPGDQAFTNVSCVLTFLIKIHKSLEESLRLSKVTSETLKIDCPTTELSSTSSLSTGTLNQNTTSISFISTDMNQLVHEKYAVFHEFPLSAYSVSEITEFHSVVFQWTMNGITVHSYCQVPAQRTFRGFFEKLPQSDVMMLCIENLTPSKLIIHKFGARYLSAEDIIQRRTITSFSPAPISDSPEITLTGSSFPITVFPQHTVKWMFYHEDKFNDPNAKVEVAFTAPGNDDILTWIRNVKMRRHTSSLFLHKIVTTTDNVSIRVGTSCQLAFSVRPDSGGTLPTNLEYVIDSSQSNWDIGRLVEGSINNSKDICVTVFPRKAGIAIYLPIVRIVKKTRSGGKEVVELIDVSQFHTIEVLPRTGLNGENSSKRSSLFSNFVSDSS